jgi:hypothetical protein
MYLDYMFRCNNVGWRLCPKCILETCLGWMIWAYVRHMPFYVKKCILWTCLVGYSGLDGEWAILSRIDSGKDAIGKDDTGKIDTGKIDTGKDDTGKDDTGKDDTGKDDTGKDDTGKD